ncbi:MAG: protein kinase, partial [Candidatus Promineifilaceae bacterium]|nr:protein kinase [Candidatus Promineifilaceae bacterium]
MIGTRLGPYEIIEELGKGGMATVYRAYHPPMERYVAVKVIRRQLVEELAARERFQREARIIARLEHPHLLPVYDFDGAHDPPYIVMRLLEGGTLKEALGGRRLPLVEVSRLLIQIGAALDYAHRQGVVHRDIKPSNIMIDQEGNAFVMDFGIARMTGRDVTDGGLTATGTIIGTPDYMAPEQSYGQGGITLQADIYALGVMLFEMLTGQLPFQGKTPMETMLQHLTHPVPEATELNPDLDPRIDQFIITAMAKEAIRRYATVSEFVEAVTEVLGGGLAVAPKALQAAAQESLAILVARRAEDQERTDATLAEFAASRGESVAKFDSQPTPTQQHRTVTALFVDAAEYGELLDLEEGPETARRAVHELWMTTTLAVEGEGGAVFGQSERDLLAVWGAVSAREDDPERAVRAALSVRQALGQRVGHLLGEDEPLPIRLGLNTGPALIALDDETDSYSASGATISLASRVARNADGLILATHDTFRHIQGVFTMEEDLPIRVRRAGGRAEVSTYRILEVKPRAFRLQPRGVEGVETRMIGRRAELEQLQKAFFNAIEDSETQLVTVVGAAGLGKSRLLYEFAAWAELRPHPYFIFRGRARPGMSQRPYSLWRDILSFRFEILDSDSPDTVRQKLTSGIAELIGPAERLAHLMGYLAGFDLADSPFLNGEPQDVAEQSRRAVAEFLGRLTAIDPVIIQLEDLHHADEASLDLLAEVTGNDPGLPLLLVGLTRPALYERRPTWGSGQDFHLHLELRPLDKRDSRDLVAEIMQRVDEVPRQLRDLLVERAEGNPYYMEELVKMLVEDRVIKKLSESRWAVEVSRLQGLRIPLTLVGLLQARFDSLLYPEKLTLQRAAVVGRVFYDRALLMLDAADETHVDDLVTVLQNLTEREFIFPRELSAFEGSAEYIFAQAMMRDLVLETLLERQATAYHRAAAQWLAAQGGARVGEYDALIAQHYEQAGDRVPAAEHYYRAAKAAFAVSAVQEGIRASEKALALLG